MKNSIKTRAEQLLLPPNIRNDETFSAEFLNKIKALGTPTDGEIFLQEQRIDFKHQSITAYCLTDSQLGEI